MCVATGEINAAADYMRCFDISLAESSTGEPLSELLPRVFCFLRHNMTAVRLAALRVVLMALSCMLRAAGQRATEY
jgi:hypothetical protein